jgi:hypothetical protein
LGAGFEVLPERQLFAEPLGLAKDLLGGALVLPEGGRADARVQIG